LSACCFTRKTCSRKCFRKLGGQVIAGYPQPLVEVDVVGIQDGVGVDSLEIGAPLDEETGEVPAGTEA
jgi:hypothetical protein